jgi:hypothetical protein
MYEELYGGSRPAFVGKMGNGIVFPETLASQQEMTGVISSVLDALETSDIQPATEAEMKRLIAVCRSWGYSALRRGPKDEVVTTLGTQIWGTGSKRIKTPPFGPFGPESVQKACSCQMERKCQFLTADTRGDSMVFSHVVAKAPDGWWFAGHSVKEPIRATDAPLAARSAEKTSDAGQTPEPGFGAHGNRPREEQHEARKRWWEFWK